MRDFRDRDFVESREGLMFCVIGNVHPEGRILAYLKYVPHLPSKVRTKWSRDGVMYGRILPYYSAMGVRATMDFLRRRYPEYVVFDRYRSVELTEVPRDRVGRHYRPEERLREIAGSPRDPLEELALELVSELSDASGVSERDFGITGSILLGIHDPRYSDVDVVVYGRRSGWAVRDALRELYRREGSGFRLPKGGLLRAWSEDIASRHPLTLEEAMLLYSRFKWNRALYRGRQFSVHPVKLESEVDERWEDKVHRPLGLAKVRARVVDSSDSIFMPAVYVVEGARVVEGPEPPGRVSRVVSYEGLYIDLAEPGDEIVAYGKLEEVHDLRTGETYYQLTVGTFEAGGRDFVKPVKWLSHLGG